MMGSIETYRPTTRFVLLLLIWGTTCLGTVHARGPEIRNLNIRGLQIGGTTTLTIDGVDLLPEPAFFLNDKALTVKILEGSTPTRLVVETPLPDSFTPGFAQLRISTVDGFSKGITLALDRLVQSVMTDTIAAPLPLALHGAVAGSSTSKTVFAGKAGDEIVIEVEAQRLGSKLRPIVQVFDSHRILIEWGRPSNSLSGDTRVSLRLPRDDQYSIEIHDAQYAPPGTGFFRLKVGRWDYSDFVFPPAIQRGIEAELELLGNSPGQKIKIPAISDLGLTAVPVNHATLFSGQSPTIEVTSVPELLQTSDSADTQLITTLPVAVSGRLNSAGQRNRILVPVKEGQKLIAEVFAERLGSRIDAAIELKNAQGAILIASDDTPMSLDPRVEFAIPAGLDKVEIAVRDTLDLAARDSIYRLLVTTSDAVVPDFQVKLRADLVNVADGEFVVVEAFAERRGYSGVIKLEPQALSPGLTVLGTEIPAGASGTLFGIKGAAGSAARQVVRIKASSEDGTITKMATVDLPTDGVPPVGIRELVAVATLPKETQPFEIEWMSPETLPQLVKSTKGNVVVKLKRPGSTLGPVRLSLVTSQLPPMVNGQPNPTQAIRLEQPQVEVAVGNTVKTASDALAALKTQHDAAVKQAQSAQGDAKTAADASVATLLQKVAAAQTTLTEAEAKAAYSPTVSLVIPATVTETICDLTLRAELLNVQRNSVLRTVYSPIRRLSVVNPMVIKLSGAATAEAVLDSKTGASVKFAGMVERVPPFQGDVTVTLTGLPAGVSAANVIVKSDKTAFEIEIKIPANFAGNDIRGMKLTAIGPPDPLAGNQPSRSSDVDLVIGIRKAS